MADLPECPVHRTGWFTELADSGMVDLGMVDLGMVDLGMVDSGISDSGIFNSLECPIQAYLIHWNVRFRNG